MTKYSRGSEWRKWDLHIHSNASDGTSTPEEIIAEAKKKGLSVIALTDHHTVDNIDKIKEIANLSENSDIVVISGIEFRSEYGAKSVHFIGLFPDTYNGTKLHAKALYDLILSPLGISKTAIIKKGKESNSSLDDAAAFKAGMFKVQVDLKEAATLIHKHGGIVSIHNGSKSNGLDSEVKHLGNSPGNVNELYESLGTLKEELLKEHIDICEIRKANDSEQFYLDKFLLPSITASDAHKTSDIGRSPVWIKADPTFEGLRQIIFEPEERVKIQEERPEFKAIYNLLDSISLDKDSFWHQNIPINSNLTVIIGGRSTGKSTLLESIARKIIPDKFKRDSDSEINTEKRNKFFTDHIDGISVSWTDKSAGNSRTVDYFPQSHMYEIARAQSKVDELIQRLVLESNENEKIIRTYKNEIKSNRDSIIENCETLYSLIGDLVEYTEKVKTIGNIKGIQESIEQLQKSANDLKVNAGISKDALKDFEVKRENLSSERHILETLEKDKVTIEGFKSKSILDSSFRYAFNVLSEDKRNLFDIVYDQFSAKVKTAWDKYINTQLQKLQTELSSSQSKIKAIEGDSIFIKGMEYISANKQYSVYQERIALEKENLKQAELTTQKRNLILRQIENLKQEIIKLHLEFETKIANMTGQIHLNVGDLAINAKPCLKTDDMKAFLEQRLIKRSDAQKGLIAELSDRYSVDTGTKIKDFFNGLLDGSIQYTAGNNAQNILSDFLAMNWFNISYDLTYQGDGFYNMSPGKQAFVILKLLLEFSSRKCPILIDQPEDSLDNRAIYTELVTYLKAKKKERQIILVSHNPNVVVGADAEQVIVANQHGDNSPNTDGIKFQYYSGALEDSHAKDSSSPTILESQGIREHVCDILEGGQEAFNRREKKYGFHD